MNLPCSALAAYFLYVGLCTTKKDNTLIALSFILLMITDSSPTAVLWSDDF